MAKDKNGFVIYRDLIHTIKKMVEDDRNNKTNNAGELFYHLLQYVNDENPEAVNMIVDLTFEPIKQSLKRDLVKYRALCEKNSKNARIRWDKENTNASERIPSDAKHADSDKDSDKEKDIKKKRERFAPPGLDNIIEFLISKGITVPLAHTEADKFIHHYESNGWKVGKNKMVSWKHAVGNWITRMDDFKSNGATEKDGVPANVDMLWYNDKKRTIVECAVASRKWYDAGFKAIYNNQGKTINFVKR